MLAFRAEVETWYDPSGTILSLLIAVIFVAAGIEVVGRTKLAPGRVVAGGILVGLGVAAMHYTGMEAMTLPGTIAYRPGPFVLSVLVAIGAATTALLLAFTLREARQRAVAALVMAVAISGMHYTGMAATTITLDPGALVSGPGAGVELSTLAGGVAGATYGLLLLALVAAIADRRASRAVAAEAGLLREANVALEAEVTERRRVEQALEAARDELETRVQERTRDLEEARERAEAASRAKSDFLASMSHELRTPLNAILGFAQLLGLNSAREPLSPKQQRAAHQILSSGERLLFLIDEVLDLASIESGRLTLSMEAVAPGAVLDEVLSALQPVAAGAEVTVTVRGAGDAPPVTADRIRLAQVMTNLIANGIKYNRRGGGVEIAVERGRDGTVSISVVDTGLGIPSDRMAELFQPFCRLGQEHGPIEGTGIGLAITRRLVDAMHGSISVRSAPGVGSEFRVTLPVSAVSPEVPEPEPAAMAIATKAQKLLYVEDNPSNVLLMRDLAETIGSVELLVAADPRVGLDLARAHRPDVVVLDINLPGLDGFEVLRRLKADPATAAIPVLALSAAAMPREVERGLAAGFRRYLTKPLRVGEFLAALDEAMGARDAA
jgi:signal transduction histidine kinase/ActR/RegA family two-component response regulator